MKAAVDVSQTNNNGAPHICSVVFVPRQFEDFGVIHDDVHPGKLPYDPQQNAKKHGGAAEVAVL